MVAKKSYNKNGLIAAAVFAVSALGAAPTVALAAGGGGGGGGSLPSSSSGPRVDPAQSYREGIEALEAQDYREAEKKFGEVLSVARDNPEANYYMGVAKVGRGKDKRAIRYFKRAVKERSDFVEAREQLALALVATEKQDEAVEQLEALQSIRAGCDDGACTGAFTERTDRAIAKVSAALGDGSGGEDISALPLMGSDYALLHAGSYKDGELRYSDAVRFIHNEEYNLAIAELYKAQAAVGPHPDILNYLGYSHRKTGDYASAKSYYAKALSLNPDHLGATEYLGELYLELGDVKNARRQLAKLDKLCVFGCAEREDLAHLIAVKTSLRSASRE